MSPAVTCPRPARPPRALPSPGPGPVGSQLPGAAGARAEGAGGAFFGICLPGREVPAAAGSHLSSLCLSCDVGSGCSNPLSNLRKMCCVLKAQAQQPGRLCLSTPVSLSPVPNPLWWKCAISFPLSWLDRDRRGLPPWETDSPEPNGPQPQTAT